MTAIFLYVGNRSIMLLEQISYIVLNKLVLRVEQINYATETN
jgi:hypothetical protein